MTSIIDSNGSMVAVTLLSASPNTVTQVKTVEKDGYQAVQLGYEKARKPGKTITGHSKKSGEEPAKYSREVRLLELPEGIKEGDKIDVNNFEVGDIVSVTGTSKGKGFAGTVKRHNFRTSAESHGGNGVVRKPGSIGSMYPQRVFKGKKMAGQYGNTKVTVERLRVALVDSELNVIGVVGAVPGPKKSIVMLREAKR